MENLNIDQYLNKVDGNTLPANEWNACLTAVQTKVNELVGAVSNDIVVNSISSPEDTMPESYSITPQHVKVGHAGLGTTTVSADNINIAYNSPKAGRETSLSLNELSIEHNSAYNGSESVSVKPGEISVSTFPLGEESKEITISAADGISVNGNTGITTSFVVNGVEYAFVNGILVSNYYANQL